MEPGLLREEPVSTWIRPWKPVAINADVLLTGLVGAQCVAPKIPGLTGTREQLLQSFQIICSDIHAQPLSSPANALPSACIQSRSVRIGCGNVAGFRVGQERLFEKGSCS